MNEAVLWGSCVVGKLRCGASGLWRGSLKFEGAAQQGPNSRGLISSVPNPGLYILHRDLDEAVIMKEV